MSFVVHRVAKSAARYTDAGGREKCGYCRFFVAPRACGKVIGPVSPQGWCKYFSRQVAQQYSGAGITGGGGPPGATLALDFMSSGNMPAGVTFTRASTATYTDASGVIQTAAVNQPRWDYASGSLRGLLIEGASTNLLLWSGDVNNAAWSKSGSGGPAMIPGTTTTAPNGGAVVLCHYADNSGGFGLLNQPVTVAAQPHAFSVWLKGFVGGEQIYLCVSGSAFYSSPRLTLTTSWRRYTFITPALAAGTQYFAVGGDTRDPAQTPMPSADVFVWGAQVEQGAFATSYIPTTTATVARSPDLASMAFTPAAAGTYAVRFIPAGAASALPVIMSGNAGSPVMAIGADSRLVASIRSGASVFSGVAPAMTFNAVNKTAFGWLTGASKAAVNGALLGANAVALTVTGTTIQFGSDGVTPGNNAINGVLQAVSGWPRQLSDAELQQVTT